MRSTSSTWPWITSSLSNHIGKTSSACGWRTEEASQAVLCESMCTPPISSTALQFHSGVHRPVARALLSSRQNLGGGWGGGGGGMQKPQVWTSKWNAYHGLRELTIQSLDGCPINVRFLDPTSIIQTFKLGLPQTPQYQATQTVAFACSDLYQQC